MVRKQDRLNNVQARGRINASYEDDVWSNRSDEADLAPPQPSKKPQSSPKKSSVFGNLAAFGIPFVAVAAIVGVQKNFFLPPESEVVQGDTSNEDVVVTTPPESDPNELEVSTETVDVSDADATTAEISVSLEETPSLESGTDVTIVNESVEAGEIIEDAVEEVTDLEVTDSAVESNAEEGLNEDLTVAEETPPIDEGASDDLIEDDFIADLPEGGSESENVAAQNQEISEQEQKLRRELAQLQYRRLEILKSDQRDPEATIRQLQTLLDDTQNASTPSSLELQEEFDKFVEELIACQKELEAAKELLNVLREYDQASLSSETASLFFTENASIINSGSDESALDARRQDLIQVGAELDALTVIDAWNQLLDAHSQELERFRTPNKDAEAALRFLADNADAPGLPREAVALKRRIPEWEFQTSANVPTQRKILLRLESEIAQKYWTYSPSPEKYYYLPAPPKAGINEYIANTSGATQQIDIPASAPETQTSESLQAKALRALSKRARLIPDSLVEEDPAKWYDSWRIFLEELQTIQDLDPIVRYTLFRDCVKLLASSDYYFAQRLESFQRMLNAPQLAEGVSIDRFQTDSSELQDLRRLASSRINFLPKNHLVVDKTTEQLNASIERFDFVYRRVGWLDRDLANVWRCRRPEDEPLPIGDLYVVVIARDPNGQSSAKWSKIGESNGKRIALKLATNNIPIGSIVFCRVAMQETRPIAKRASVERFFNR